MRAQELEAQGAAGTEQLMRCESAAFECKAGTCAQPQRTVAFARRQRRRAHQPLNDGGGSTRDGTCGRLVMQTHVQPKSAPSQGVCTPSRCAFRAPAHAGCCLARATEGHSPAGKMRARSRALKSVSCRHCAAQMLVKERRCGHIGGARNVPARSHLCLVAAAGSTQALR